MDPLQHDDLMWAANLVRQRRGRPGLSQLMASLGEDERGGGGDGTGALLKMLMENMSRSRELMLRDYLDRQGRRESWGQALRQQAMQAALKRADEEEALARREASPDTTQERRLRDAQIAGAEEANRRGREAPTAERQADDQEFRSLGNQLAGLEAQGERVPDSLLKKHNELAARLGREPYQPGAAQAGLNRRQREVYAGAAFGAGDLLSAQQIEQGVDPQKTAMGQAAAIKRETERAALLEEAARELDKQAQGGIKQLMGMSGVPWGESADVTTQAFWSKDRRLNRPVERAAQLQRLVPKYKAFGITPEEIAAQYEQPGFD